jgi:hypothetical protein
MRVFWVKGSYVRKLRWGVFGIFGNGHNVLGILNIKFY